jgi:hypothetical protein
MVNSQLKMSQEKLVEILKKTDKQIKSNEQKNWVILNGRGMRLWQNSPTD